MMMKRSSQARKEEGHDQNVLINVARAMEMGHTKRQERVRKKRSNTSKNKKITETTICREKRKVGEGKGGRWNTPSCFMCFSLNLFFPDSPFSYCYYSINR